MNERGSKTAAKKRLAVVAELAEQLLSLKPPEIDALPLPDQVIAEIKHTRQISSFSALRRQKRYLTRLLDGCDLTAVQQLQERKRIDHFKQIKHFHRIENWRDRLIAGDAMEEFLRVYPLADRELLQLAIIAARNARDDQKGPKRSLFRMIENIIQSVSDQLQDQSSGKDTDLPPK